MDHEHYSDAYLQGILASVKTIALVGASANEARPSYGVMNYLIQHGFIVHPVNPGLAGQQILGRNVYGRLTDVPGPIDMIDVFRASEHVPGVVDEALALSPLPKAIWMQLGVRHDEAATKAEAAGIKVVMNRCAKIEHHRLF